ncbi:Kelch repeat-containing protein [Sorangium sp. So ce1182]|uniref:Kelch repeat-containing protein n=1 Tax=Sorangium sp. So ce1182 TaxID=3133334 RepID=UPI003F611EE2
MQSIGRLGGAALCGLVMLRAGAVWAASAPSWETVPPMITPRGEHSATVLQDGRVLVVGGYPELDAFPYTDTEALSLREVEIYDPATRTWSPAAPLGQRRRGHAAVLLPNGHVLVAGGRATNEQGFGPEIRSTETYDPASNTWTTAGRLPLPQPDPWMMLVGGKPMLVGMAWNEAAVSTQLQTAVYDPESRAWTTLPTCSHESSVHPVSATLLHDGRVMAIGIDCSLYDPETRLWTREHGALMPTRTYRYPDAATLPGGGVLVVGGTPSGPDPEVHAFAQVYLPEDERWEPTSGPYAPASTPCRPSGDSSIRGMRTALLPSGRVLLTGGVQPCQPRDSSPSPIFPFHATMALFDEGTRAFSPLGLEPPVTMARAYHSATPLRDGSVLIAGGHIDGLAATRSAVLFHERSPLGEGCATDSDCGSGFCADSVCCDAPCAGSCDACALAAGASQDGVCTPLTGVACDDADACVAGGVCEAGACVGGEAAPDGTPCSDGDVCSAASVCAGGACVGSSIEECLPADDCREAPACDPAAGCALPGPAKPDSTPCGFPGTEAAWQGTGRIGKFLGSEHPRTTVLLDGTVLVITDGVIATSTRSEPLWVRYDPSTGAWQPAGAIGDMLYARTPTLLPDGTVLVIGSALASEVSSPAKRFDPATGVWTPAAPTLTPRWRHTATLLADGRVLVAGGDADPYTDGRTRVEIYDPVADAWTAAAPMNAARQYHTATLLQDGAVLVAGGAHQGSRLASAEVYDPATDTWTVVGSMRWSRSDHAATLLADGRVLVVGIQTDESVKVAEIYDPTSGTWSSTGEMAAARRSPGAALLADGRVLVTGEALGSNDGALAAELYDPASGSWALAPALDVMVVRHATALLNDGRVLIAGGRAGTTRSEYQVIDNAWLYVPAQPAARGMCQTGACVPGDGEGGGGGTGGDGGGGAGDGGGGSEGGGGPSGGGGAGGADTGGHGGDASGGGGAGGADTGGHGGDASGGGGAGGAATGGHGGESSVGVGGNAGGGHGGDASGGAGGNASGSGGGPTGGGGDASGGGGAGGTVTGGHGGDASNGGDGTSTATGAGSDDTASTSASATSTQSSGGGDLLTAGGGGGCRMTPGSQGTPAWLLALGALATARLRRRLPRTSRPVQAEDR